MAVHCATKLVRLFRRVRRDWQIYLLILPTIIYFVVFCYIPMYGAQIAFRDYIPMRGVWASRWVGFKHFERFFQGPFFIQVVGNTLRISLYSIIAGFPLPILLAILLNYQRYKKFGRIVKSVSIAPHFISTVVLVGMLQVFFSVYNGPVSKVLACFGHEMGNVLASPTAFDDLYVWSGIWQGTGWSAIIYIGALTTISPEMHEAAVVDGASIVRRIISIDIPLIMPTIMLVLIMNCGSILSVGFEKAYLLQNSINATASEVISTYVYKQGMQGSQFSYSSAVGLFNSGVNFLLILIVNAISKRLTLIGLF